MGLKEWERPDCSGLEPEAEALGSTGGCEQGGPG